MIGFGIGINDEDCEPMKHGWYLRSDGYMTSECSYQRIEAMKSNRALDNHGELVFVKYTGGEEIDSRVYIPHPGTCKNEWAQFGKFRCSECWLQIDSISTNTTAPIPIKYCPNCGRRVK